jgi:hypothetical protein
MIFRARRKGKRILRVGRRRIADAHHAVDFGRTEGQGSLNDGSGGMVDLESVNEAARRAWTDFLAQVRARRFVNALGEPIHYAAYDQLAGVARAAVRGAMDFDIAKFAEYAQQFPEMLNERYSHRGRLAEKIELALLDVLMKAQYEELVKAAHGQYPADYVTTVNVWAEEALEWFSDRGEHLPDAVRQQIPLSGEDWWDTGYSLDECLSEAAQTLMKNASHQPRQGRAREEEPTLHELAQRLAEVAEYLTVSYTASTLGADTLPRETMTPPGL